MSVLSERPAILRSLPRLVLLSLGWILLCRVLRDVVPVPWAWAALPPALLAGSITGNSRLRIPSALALIIGVPFVLRLLAFLFFIAMPFDNGWLLTAPYWYFAAFSTFLFRRYRGWGRIEALILSLFIALVLSGGNPEFPELSAPVQATFRLSTAILTLVFTALAFIVSAPKTKGRNGPGARILHVSLLVLLLVLLVIGGARLRREDALREGGGVLAGDLFRFDFNDVLSLEPEISLNAELTMLYREDGPPVSRLLRRFTLSGWDDVGGYFRDGDRETDIPDAPAHPVTLPRGPRSWDPGDFESRVLIDQEYYLIALDPASLFSLNMPVSVEPWIIWDDASFSRAYGVESSVSVAGPWELFSAGSGKLDSRWREYYLEGGDDEGYRLLAEEAAQGAEGSWEQAVAIERWFHDNYYYSLEPGLAPDGDQLSWFLYETRRGYCSYYAFAMTRMCRSLGIPARVAVGFVTDPESSVLGFVPVRSDQAHAWVEIWLDDFGWIEFDPTSQVMAPGEEYPVQFISPDQWLPLVEEVLARSGEIDIALAEEQEELQNSWWKELAGDIRDHSGFFWLLVPLLLLIAYLPGRIIPAFRYMKESRSPDPRRRSIARWRHYVLLMIRIGRGPGVRETPLAWSGRISSPENTGPSDWCSLYLKAVFSPVFTDSDLAEAEELSKLLRGRLREEPARICMILLLGPGWRGRSPW